MPEFARAFRKAFPDLPPANHFVDELMSGLRHTPVLDTMKLDEAIISKHGEYPDGVSMKDFVLAQYGPKAVDFVLAMIHAPAEETDLQKVIDGK